MSQEAPVASPATDAWTETSTHITLHDSIGDPDSGIEFLCCPKQITQSLQQYLSVTPAHSHTKMRVLKRTKVFEEAEVNKKMKIQEVSFTAQVQQLQSELESTKKQFEHEVAVLKQQGLDQEEKIKKLTEKTAKQDKDIQGIKANLNNEVSRNKVTRAVLSDLAELPSRTSPAVLSGEHDTLPFSLMVAQCVGKARVLSLVDDPVLTELRIQGELTNLLSVSTTRPSVNKLARQYLGFSQVQVPFDADHSITKEEFASLMFAHLFQEFKGLSTGEQQGTGQEQEQ